MGCGSGIDQGSGILTTDVSDYHGWVGVVLACVAVMSLAEWLANWVAAWPDWLKLLALLAACVLAAVIQGVIRAGSWRR